MAGRVWFGGATAATWIPAFTELHCHQCGNSFQSYHPLKLHKITNQILRLSFDMFVLNPSSTNCDKNQQEEREINQEKQENIFNRNRVYSVCTYYASHSQCAYVQILSSLMVF